MMSQYVDIIAIFSNCRISLFLGVVISFLFCGTCCTVFRRCLWSLLWCCTLRCSSGRLCSSSLCSRSPIYIYDGVLWICATRWTHAHNRNSCSTHRTRSPAWPSLSHSPWNQPRNHTCPSPSPPACSAHPNNWTPEKNFFWPLPEIPSCCPTASTAQ